METISSHTVKYWIEKYFKNKLIKNFAYFDLGKKSEFKCTPQRASNIKALFQFSFQLSRGRGYNLKKVPQSHASKFAETQLGFVEVRSFTVK